MDVTGVESLYLLKQFLSILKGEYNDTQKILVSSKDFKYCTVHTNKVYDLWNMQMIFFIFELFTSCFKIRIFYKSYLIPQLWSEALGKNGALD